MNSTHGVDIVIIGGGIVGLATALTLSVRFPKYRFLLLEKEREVGLHQTSHNSGVIHSGIYYQTGSLKAKLCVEGVKAMIGFAQENNIPYELCGKIILATNDKELPWLQTLFERGKANGIQGLEIISSTRIRELEPNAQGISAIYSPNTGIINYRLVAEIMKTRFVENGGSVQLGSKVRKIQNRNQGVVIETERCEVAAKFLINCGGLYSDFLCRMMGIDPKVSIIPFRGEYCIIRPERKSIIRNLIYPLPQPELPFLGVHFTRTIDGQLEVGPNAVLALAREAYSRTQVNFGEMGSMFTHSIFWKMISKYWKTGIFECYKSLSKKTFVQELKRFVPSIQESDLIDGPSGVRAQCVEESGTLVNDFKIIEHSHSIHVLNVPSPAATASLTIGDYIAKLARVSFSLQN